MQNARAAIHAPARRNYRRLVTEPELLNQLTVRLDIRPSQIVQQPATLAYHLQEAAATMMVLSVLAEMIRQVIDALSKDRNLNFGGPGVDFVGPMLLNRRRFIECHCERLRVFVELCVAVELRQLTGAGKGPRNVSIVSAMLSCR
jgi:hypothetical protein